MIGFSQWIVRGGGNIRSAPEILERVKSQILETHQTSALLRAPQRIQDSANTPPDGTHALFCTLLSCSNRIRQCSRCFSESFWSRL